MTKKIIERKIEDLRRLIQINEKRLNKNISQRQIAEVAGVTKQAVSAFFAGNLKSVKIESALKELLGEDYE